jgi:phosphopantetheinyl transferase
MRKIRICVVEPDTIQRRREVVGHILRFLFNLDAGFLEFQIDQNGKPRAIAIGDQDVFCSFSHARKVEPPFGIVAVSLDMDVGVDVELWPVGSADPDFLLAISANEDEAALAALNFCKRDSGVALWVIKEAALKCTGEVMTDPRSLAVTYEGEDVFLVRTSALAGAPHPEIRVRLLVLKGAHLPHMQFICGIALSAGCDAGVIIHSSLFSADQRWQTESFMTS